MNLLGSAFYDPTGGAAVSKATTALLAMTALDTTNLRVAFTAPLSGKVKVVMSGGALHGAATYPFILLGILQSASVIARVVPNVTVCGAASATTPASLYAEFVVAVTPGAALTWDMAYGVEGLVAATGLKYGGPNNNTTAGDAFGGISFSVWDAAPVYLPAVMPTTSVQAQAVANGAKLPAALVGGRMDSSVGAMAADVLTAAATASDFGTEVGTAVWAATTRLLTAGTNIALAKGTGVIGFNDLSAAQVNAEADTALADVGLTSTVTGRIDAAISTRSTYAGADTSGTTTLLSRLTAGRATGLDNLDTTVSSRLASAGYTAPDNTSITAIKGVVDKLDTAIELDGAVYRFTTNALEQAPSGGGGGLDAAGVRAAVGLATANLDTQFGTLATAANLATVDTVVDAIKAQTDQVAFTDGYVDANLKSVAGTYVNGAGTSGDPWGP